MVTIISNANATISFRTSIPFARTTSSSYNLETTAHWFIGSSSSPYFTSKKLSLRSLNQQKVGFRSGFSLRRFVISCGVTEIDQTQFSETVLGSDLPVLVEFVANWCGPCRLISPAIDWASQEYKDRLKVVKIDHDSNPQLIEEYKVYGLPTLILFKNGQEVPESRREGAMTKVKLKEYIDGLLESIAVA